MHEQRSGKREQLCAPRTLIGYNRSLDLFRNYIVCANLCFWSDKISISQLIIKIAFSLIVIGLKNSYFPLIHSPSCYRTACCRTVCYRTVQQTNHIQSCSLNQPITTLVSITIETVYKLLNLCTLSLLNKVCFYNTPSEFLNTPRCVVVTHLFTVLFHSSRKHTFVCKETHKVCKNYTPLCLLKTHL